MRLIADSRAGRGRRPANLGIAASLLAALGCSPVVEEPVGGSSNGLGERVRQTEQATVASPVDVFQAAIDAGAVLAGTTAVHIGDRVQIKNATNGFAPISNTGTGTTPSFITYLGTDAKTGTLWSRTKVELRDRVRIYGAVRTNRDVIRGNQVVIDHGTVTGPLGVTKDILEPLPTLPVRSNTPLTIGPGEDINLQPGSHASVTVQSGGTLRLDADTYSFSNVIVEWGGKIVTQSNCGAATLEARNGFTFRGTVLEHGGDDPGIGLIVRYEGVATSNIESAFRGVLIAPKAEINLGTAAHEGRFFGKIVRIQAGGSVKDFAPFTGATGGCGKGIELPPPAALVPSDIGPAPALTSPEELDTFLDWFYGITNAEKPAAEDKIQAVSSTSGIRQAVIQRFEAARASRAFGKALMLLAMLGALRDAEVRVFLIDLLSQPVNFSQDPYGEQATRYDDEVSYRRQALNILNSYGSPEATSVVLNVAQTHPIGAVRGAAIQALRYQKSPSEIAILRGQIQSSDEFYLDLPLRSSPTFAADTAAFRNKFSN